MPALKAFGRRWYVDGTDLAGPGMCDVWWRLVLVAMLAAALGVSPDTTGCTDAEKAIILTYLSVCVCV